MGRSSRARATVDLPTSSGKSVFALVYCDTRASTHTNTVSIALDSRPLKSAIMAAPPDASQMISAIVYQKCSSEHVDAGTSSTLGRRPTTGRWALEAEIARVRHRSPVEFEVARLQYLEDLSRIISGRDVLQPGLVL